MASTCLCGEMVVWTKLHENQPLINSSAQVKHIIEGKPADDRSLNAATAAVRLIEVDDDSAGQRLDNFLIRHLKGDRKSTRLNSSHLVISYAVFCLKKKKKPEYAQRHGRTSLCSSVQRPGVPTVC